MSPLTQKLIILIEKAVEGVNSAESDFREWQMEEGEPTETEQEAWHGLQHFFADKDIRSKDPEYQSYMVGELRKMIQELQE